LYCSNLTSVTISKSVTSIGSLAFGFCSSLRAVYSQGDAPRVGSSVFSGANNATGYYLPGTTGWSEVFGDRPTALWLAQIQTTDASFGVRTNQFGFNIAWASGMTATVEAYTNLANPVWSPLQTNTLTSDSLYFSDPEWTNHPARFYRIRWP